jgi:hypothetical protein
MRNVCYVLLLLPEGSYCSMISGLWSELITGARHCGGDSVAW